MNARPIAIAAAILVSAAGCAVAPSESPSVATPPQGRSASGIQGGAIDTGHPAAGALYADDRFSCSAALIAPSVVLTAGHCINSSINQFCTGTGEPFGGPSKLTCFEIDNAATSPDYAFGSCPNANADVGLYHLTAPVVGITPMAYATAAPPGTGVCTTVGYGTYVDPSGRIIKQQKRAGTCTISDTGDSYIECTFQTAIADRGDSGGPLILGDKIVAVTSCHTDGTWPDHRIEQYARVDGQAAWIASMIADFSP